MYANPRHANLVRTLRQRWAVPAASGVLIVAALATRQLLDPAVGHLLMVAAAVVAGSRIAAGALAALRTGSIGVELLVTVAAAGAVVIGEYWEAAAVTFLFAVGGALEATTIGRTRQAVAALLDLAPATAVVVRDGRQQQVPAAQVVVGETVVVKHGARVPVDGVITDGQATVDESSITGESIPVEKSTGDRVFAGTTNLGGFAMVRATGTGADTTLARIIHRVEQAQEQKVRAQRFMERFARWYTPGIVALAVLAGVVTGDVVLALTLLVIGCPGALVISMPVSIIAGIGRAARRGILVKGGEHLETLAKITTVALDKTGTLTTGRPRLTDLRPVDGITATELLAWAAAAEAGSEHPLAVPVLAAADQAGVAPPGHPEGVRSHPGRGIEAVVRGQRVLVGSPALLAESGVAVSPADLATVAALAAAGRTRCWSRSGIRCWVRWPWPTRYARTRPAWWPPCTASGSPGWSCSPVTTRRWPRQWHARPALLRYTLVCCRRTKRRRWPGYARTVTGSPWSATGSMTPRRWLPPTPVRRWAWRAAR